MNSGIYAITNINNMKRYVGSSLDFERRKKYHFTSLENDKHHNTPLQCSYNKHGECAFVWTMLELVDSPEDLKEREQWWINHLTPFRKYGYNVCRFTTGVSQRKEVRKKLSNAMTGYERTPEHCRNISKSKMGHTLSKESRKRISKNRKGKYVGSMNHNAKLTEEDVIEMRNRFIPRKNGRQLREEYGVSKSTFYKIINGSMWTHI